MQPYNERPSRSRKRVRVPASWLPVAAFAAVLTLGAFAPDARAQNGGADEVPLDEASMIIETNASDCDAGLQIFFDGGPWNQMKIWDPNERLVFDLRLKSTLKGFGLAEHFNESSEPPMEELVAAFPEFECDPGEFTLAEFFELFPEGTYEFEGRTVEGEELEGEAEFSHVIPLNPEITESLENDPQDPDNTVISWAAVTLPILPGLGPVNIVRYQVIVELDDGNSLQVEVPAVQLEVMVPPNLLEPGTEYKFEVLAIDETGNQTITESSFETMP